MTSIGEQIKYARTAKGISQNQLAKRAGISQAGLSAIENTTKSPNIDTLNRIANALGIPITALLGDPQIVTSRRPKTKKTIPVLGQIPAGIPIEAIEDVLDYEDLSEQEAADDFEYFGLRIKGNSMYPEYQDGDTIIVRRQDTAETGDDAVVMVNGYDATFKRIKRSADGIILMPINTTDFEPTFYSNAQIESLPIRVLGICVELRRKKR